MERPKKPVFCPTQQGTKGSRAVDRFDTRRLLGLETAEAAALARRNGCALRVTVRDGRDLARTLDFSSGRINVTETDGRVVRLNGVG